MPLYFQIGQVLNPHDVDQLNAHLSREGTLGRNTGCCPSQNHVLHIVQGLTPFGPTHSWGYDRGVVSCRIARKIAILGVVQLRVTPFRLRQTGWSLHPRVVAFTHPDKVTQRDGQNVLSSVRKLIKLLARRAQLTAQGYRRSLDRLRREMLKAIRGVPKREEALKIAHRFRKHAASYFTFMDHKGVDPTNNRTGQKIQFVTTDRKVTHGTNGEIGWQWRQHIWSTIGTCRPRARAPIDSYSTPSSLDSPSAPHRR